MSDITATVEYRISFKVHVQGIANANLSSVNPHVLRRAIGEVLAAAVQGEYDEEVISRVRQTTPDVEAIRKGSEVFFPNAIDMDIACNLAKDIVAKAIVAKVEKVERDEGTGC